MHHEHKEASMARSVQAFENQTNILILFELGLLDHRVGLKEVVEGRLGDLGLQDAHVCDEVRTSGCQPQQSTKYAAELACFGSCEWSVAILGALNFLSLESCGELLLIHLVSIGDLGVA